MLARPRYGASPQFAAGARPRRLTAWVAVATGALLLVGATATACAQRPAPTVGASNASALVSVPPTPSGDEGPTVAGALPAVATAVPPTRLRIAKLGLDAAVDPVGVDERTGDFAVPASVDLVGWYRYGPGLEARAGSIVVAGHVDSA